ncbi:MAG: carboxypeptidase-like regulatory domain-containing protein, partial [Bdellovibrionota bacterium]
MKLTFTKWFALAVVALLCIGSSVVLAQGITTAAIDGIVTSTTGETLPGANVIAVHNPSGTTYGTSSRPNGRYNLPNLRVGGPYTVTVSYVGYKKQVKEDVYLT